MNIIAVIKKSLNQNNSDTSILLTGNKIALSIIIAIISLTFFGFSIMNYYIGNHLLGTFLFLFLVTVLIDKRAHHYGEDLPINLNIVVTLLVLSLLLTFYYIGPTSVFWSFPISVGLFFILTLKPALFFNFIILLAHSTYCFISMDFDVALRPSISLLLLQIFSIFIILHINKLQHDLVNMAIRDPMTGVFNRRQLSVHLENCLAQKIRNNIDSAILSFDIDFFKAINDRYGHDVGDTVIIKLTKVIKEHSRDVDLLFRVGGEEFILLMQNTNENTAKQKAEMLRKILRDKINLDNKPVTVSIGVSMCEAETSTHQWIKNADIALYKAKDSGRDRVQLYDENLLAPSAII